MDATVAAPAVAVGRASVDPKVIRACAAPPPPDWPDDLLAKLSQFNREAGPWIRLLIRLCFGEGSFRTAARL